MGAWGCSSEDGAGGATGGVAGSNTSSGGGISAGGAGGANTGVAGGAGGAATSTAATATVLAPVDGTAWTTDCVEPTYFAVRGGSVVEDPADVRASSRRSVDESGYGDFMVGFRCVTTGTPDTTLGEWASVPAGTFMMGCSTGDTACKANESPAHSVTISTAFSIMKKEVSGLMVPDGTSPFALRGVPYADAVQFCADHGARLPTEAEWEYAARAGTTTVLPCSGCTLDSIAWYAGNILAQNTIDAADEYATTTSGQKTANAWGLYDMLGNAPEWVQDCYHSTY